MEYKWNTYTDPQTGKEVISLNPCFNGIQMEHKSYFYIMNILCLNPCFNGIQMEHLHRSPNGQGSD